jgi:hypothetical protein
MRCGQNQVSEPPWFWNPKLFLVLLPYKNSPKFWKQNFVFNTQKAWFCLLIHILQTTNNLYFTVEVLIFFLKRNFYVLLQRDNYVLVSDLSEHVDDNLKHYLLSWLLFRKKMEKNCEIFLFTKTFLI